MTHWMDDLEPRSEFESKKSHCIRVINKILNDGVTDMSDISTVIRNEFKYSHSIVSSARHELRKTCLDKMRILN